MQASLKLWKGLLNFCVNCHLSVNPSWFRRPGARWGITAPCVLGKLPPLFVPWFPQDSAFPVQLRARPPVVSWLLQEESVLITHREVLVFPLWTAGSFLLSMGAIATGPPEWNLS